MKTKTPETPEEVKALQSRLELIFASLEEAIRQGKPDKYRQAIARRYIRHLEAMLIYKRIRR